MISPYTSLQYSDETATYILEPISTNEFVSNDDPNIMWIQVIKLTVSALKSDQRNKTVFCRRPWRWSRRPLTWARI